MIRFLNRRLMRAAVCFLLAPMALFAQETTETTAIENGQRFGPWTVNCVAVAVGATNCTLLQRMTQQADGAFVVDLRATRDGEGNTILVARVKVGAHLPSGFAMRDPNVAEPADVLRFIWQVCTPQVCEAAVRFGPEKAAALSAADNAMIAAFRPSPQSEPLVFRMSLSEMAQGLDAIGR